MTVCMGYPAMTKRRAGKRRRGGQESHAGITAELPNKFLKGDFAYEEKQA